MNDPFFTVDWNDSAFATLVGSSGDENFIVFANGDGADLRVNTDQKNTGNNSQKHNMKYGYANGKGIRDGVCVRGSGYLVLSSEFFGERCAHDFSSVTACCWKVSLSIRMVYLLAYLARLSARRRDIGRLFGHCNEESWNGCRLKVVVMLSQEMNIYNHHTNFVTAMVALNPKIFNT